MGALAPRPPLPLKASLAGIEDLFDAEWTSRPSKTERRVPGYSDPLWYVAGIAADVWTVVMVIATILVNAA